MNSLVEAMKHTVEDELDESSLGLNFAEKSFSWKISWHEASDTDDDDQCSSSSSSKEENC